MSDFLDILSADAKATVDSGFYEQKIFSQHFSASLVRNIKECNKVAVITEVKGASPSKGVIRQSFEPDKIALEMERGGAAGISVLTEPKHFDGSLKNIEMIRPSIRLPILMKDIVVNPIQIDAASKIGANAILLIQAIYDRKYGSISLEEMIAKAHSKNLEVLLETHTVDEFGRAVQTEADMIGINNRNLGTLAIDLGTTKEILLSSSHQRKIVVSESGINTPDDLRFLRTCGAQAFLIGSAIMQSKNIEAKVKEFVNS